MPEMTQAPVLAPPRLDRDEAFGVLFRTHARGLVRLAYCLLGDRESAEDAVQDAYLSLYRNWDSLRDHGSSHAYLRSAVINRSRSGQGQLVRAAESSCGRLGAESGAWIRLN